MAAQHVETHCLHARQTLARIKRSAAIANKPESVIGADNQVAPEIETAEGASNQERRTAVLAEGMRGIVVEQTVEEPAETALEIARSQEDQVLRTGVPSVDPPAA
jgi:hypothetical protein